MEVSVLNIESKMSAGVSARSADVARLNTDKAIIKASDDKVRTAKIDIIQDKQKGLGVKEDPFKVSTVVKEKAQPKPSFSPESASVLLNASANADLSESKAENLGDLVNSFRKSGEKKASNDSVLLNAVEEKSDGLKLDISSVKNQSISKAISGYNQQADNAESVKLTVGGDASKHKGLSLKI